MKRVKNITLAVLITVIGAGFTVAKDGVKKTSVTVNNDPVELVNSQDSGYAQINQERDTGSVKIKLYNTKRNVSLIEKLDAGKRFIRPLDLGNLSPIEVNTTEEEFVQEINNRRKGGALSVTMNRMNKSESFKVVVKGVDHLPVYVDIMDENGFLLMDMVEVGKDFSRIYTFKKHNPEDFTIIVSHNNQVVIKEIR